MGANYYFVSGVKLERFNNFKTIHTLIIIMNRLKQRLNRNKIQGNNPKYKA